MRRSECWVGEQELPTVHLRAIGVFGNSHLIENGDTSERKDGDGDADRRSSRGCVAGKPRHAATETMYQEIVLHKKIQDFNRSFRFS